MSVWIKCNSIHQGHIKLSVHHYAFIGSNIHNSTDNATTVFSVLILDELTFQTKRELVDYRCIHFFGLAGSQATCSKFIRYSIAGFHTKVIRLRHMSSIRDADGKSTPSLNVFYSLMTLGKVESDSISFLHSSPCSVHNIDAAILIIGRNHQHRHRENTFGDIQLGSHNYLSF